MTPRDVSAAPPARLPPRDAATHKGDFGRVLLVGGSRGMSGAIALAGRAALRGGAGLVRLAIPDVCLDCVAALEPAYTTIPLPSDRRGRIAFSARRDLASVIAAADVVAVGPGLGRSLGLTALVAELCLTAARPLVIDADGLNALADRPGLLSNLAAHAPAAPRILTPHPGELARLWRAFDPKGEHALSRGESSSRATQTNQAHALAAACHAVVLLKGHGTLVTDGRQFAVNDTGNPGLATGGAGDVLTGLIAALLGQGLAPFDAARLAARLHGLAGDLAAAALGQVSLTANDVVAYLPEAFRRAG